MSVTSYIIAGLAALNLLIGGIGFTAYEIERGNYETEKAGRVADAKAAEDAATKKLAQAKAQSDSDLSALQAKLTDQSSTSITYVDRIVHDTPPAPSCPPSPASRDATLGVRGLVTGKDPALAAPAK